MKKHSYPPGLTLIHNEIGSIDRLLHQAEAETLRAAKILSKEILNLFPNKLPKKLLESPAIDEQCRKEELLNRTFLEVVLMRAIRESQYPTRFSSGFLVVSNTALQNIGLSTAFQNLEETGKELDLVCAEINRVTELFIFCNFTKWVVADKDPNVAEFSVNCNFLEKTIPTPEL